jgi:hypothetical protein
MVLEGTLLRKFKDGSFKGIVSGHITFVALALIIILEVFLTFLTGINPHIRLVIYPILIPLLLSFVFSIFWRTTITAVLSLAGTMCLYAGMYYTYATRLPVIENKYFAYLNIHVPLHSTSMQTVAGFYFFMGIFAVILCVAAAYKPSFFIARGRRAPIGLPYPIWNTEDNDPKYRDGVHSNGSLSLIPIQSLLSFSERHLSSNYKYIQAVICGRIYFVSLDEWVPQSETYIIRDKQSGSLVGIPKIPDGFNTW